MLVDVEFGQLMPCFLVSHKPARQKSGRQLIRKATWDKRGVRERLGGATQSHAKPLLIKKWRGRGGERGGLNPLVKHSLLQIFVELTNGFAAFALRSKDGDLALPCCLWVDINRGLRL